MKGNEERITQMSRPVERPVTFLTVHASDFATWVVPFAGMPTP